MSLYQGNETLVTKTTVTVPIDGGPVEAVSTIEAVPYWTRSRRKTGRFFSRICEGHKHTVAQMTKDCPA